MGTENAPRPATFASDSNSVDDNDNDKDCPRCSKPFYGDLVRAIAFTVIVPVSSFDVFKTRACHFDADDSSEQQLLQQHSLCTTALFTVALVTLTCALTWLAYWRHSNALSFAGFVAALWVCAVINLYQWPYSGECVITNMFQGTLFGNLCNGKNLSVRNHLVRMVLMFSVASYVSIQSPYSVYHEDVLPGLGGPMVMAMAFLVATRLDIDTITKTYFSDNNFSDYWAVLKDMNWNQLTVQGSRWVLSSIYMYHVCSELLSMSFEGRSVGANDIFAALVKASIVAGMGVWATGSFQNEIDANLNLEVMVKNRTRIIQEKNDKLHMVELALESSETAIAITDSNLSIIWLNGACRDISMTASHTSSNTATATSGSGWVIKKEETEQHQQQPPPHHNRQVLLGRPIVEVIALETILDERKLTQAFSGIRKEDEICIHGMIFRLEVSPYEYKTAKTNNNNNNANDSVGRFLVVLKNITAEKAREVAEKTAQEEAMLAKAMGDSMVTLTHELRTPMQGIMGVTGMLLQQKQNTADAVLVESLRLIMASSGLLLNLINNLLDVKKVNSKMMDEFPLSAVTATSAIQDTIDFCQPLASISGVRVVTEYGDESSKNEFKVISNSLRLQQILINLVSNAIKYTAELSEIRISIKPTTIADVEVMIQNSLASSRDTTSNTENAKEIGARPVKELPNIPSTAPVLCFSISDCGSGIAPHQADRLFRRFARLDSQPTRVLGGSNKVGQPSGTGLGLNLCQLFVQRMQGEIWAINNSNGKGSTFSFFLPLAAESAIRPQITAPVSMASKRCRSFDDLDICTTQLRVLLVDDVLINRKVIGRMVEQVGVTDIVTSDSGENALLELSENGPYDLVITDLQMPGMSGTDLCKAILSNETCGAIPRNRLPVVVGLTADTSVQVEENCRASGMSKVLYKPISVVEMMEFFEKCVMQLQPGVWYTGRGNGTVLCAQ